MRLKPLIAPPACEPHYSLRKKRSQPTGHTQIQAAFVDHSAMIPTPGSPSHAMLGHHSSIKLGPKFLAPPVVRAATTPMQDHTPMQLVGSKYRPRIRADIEGACPLQSLREGAAKLSPDEKRSISLKLKYATASVAGESPFRRDRDNLVRAHP